MNSQGQHRTLNKVEHKLDSSKTSTSQQELHMDHCGPTEQDSDRLSIVMAVFAGLHARPQDVGERMAAGYGDTGSG
ncbi:hypothetical protein [Xanthomonas vesicatoria]|uniref:hypothetical protein n=1 Tax=Xanthomonas vesicatoria TaxID=56460 RepID=UPI001364CF80|nr:hypothetical protein [Xanthomonas vesicatoria]